MKRTPEDEPSKARRGWQRGRDRPPKNSEGSTATRPKRSSRSVFGPSGDERPDVLTDAETVVLPVWLHHRPGSVGGTTAGNRASSPKTTDVPAEPDEPPGPVPDTGEPSATEAEAGGGAEAGTRDEAEAGTEAEPEPEAGTEAEAEPEAEAEAEGRTDSDTEADDNGRAAAEGTGPDAATWPTAAHPDAETIINISLADLRAAARTATTGQAPADQAETIPAAPAPARGAPAAAPGAEIDQATTVPTQPVPGPAAEAAETVEAIEAIEAKTAEAMEAIQAMAADALQAIDATAAEIAATVTGKPGPADPAHQGHKDAARPDRATDPVPASSLSPAQPRVIRIDEPPASVTLTTSATETTIALPHPRGDSTVAVTPAPGAPGVTAPALAPDRPGPPKALPPAEPRTPPQATPESAYVTTRRRALVSRLMLLAILCLQAVLSLRLHNTAFEDEALYLYSGHMELQHLLHGTALQGQYASYFSGAPVLYPVVAGFLNGLGGITAARMLSLAEMLAVTALLYSLTRRLFNERVGLCAALLFSVCESAIFLGNFATYDATCLFLLACAAWIMVRTSGFRWPVFLLAAPVAALAVGVKYAGLLFVPTIAVLPALAGWPLRGRRVLFYPPAFVVAVAGLLYGALRLGGHAYATAISSTTTHRVQGATPLTTLLKESAEWGGVIFVLAVIGTAAYVWRVRTEPKEVIAPPGGRFRRLCLGAALTGTALLAPVYQAHLHTDISFQKHIGFGLFFAAPMAALGLVRILGDHFRRPHIGVGLWSLALVLGIVQTGHLYQVWPNSTQFVRTFSDYLKPQARYLVEVPEVPIYYLLGRKDAQPRQFTSTFYINYRNSNGVLLSGTVGFTAAVKAGYFQVVAYNGEVTGAADAVLAQALAASKDYYLAAEIHITDVFGPGDYFIWVKGHPRKIPGLFHHASPKYQDLGTKLVELHP